MNVPGFVSRNWRLKVACTLLALLTWIGVVYAGNPPETRTVAVHVPQDQSFIPARFVLVHAIPDLTVRLGGSRDSLNAFNPSFLTVSVNWKAVTHAGVQAIPVSISNSDPSVELIDAPTAVQAELDSLDSVSVPVIVVTTTPPQGYVIAAQSTAPDAVTVAGPHRELVGLQARVSVDLTNQKTNFVQDKADVFIYDAHGSKLGDVGVTPPQVRIEISIAAAQTSRASAVVPSVTGRVAAGHQLAGISVDPLTVVLSGPQDLLNALDSISTQSISLNGVFGNITVTVSLTPPPGVTASPSSVTVTILVTTLPTPTPTPTPTASTSP
jgi:YbbR domain-containing protein